jgi:hypothetical protein
MSKIKQYMIEFEAKCFNTISFIMLERLSNVYIWYKLNSVAFSPQANYTDRTAAACRPS